jgi:ATPase subunit of ABC transporter with duplicated ATPase domains
MGERPADAGSIRLPDSVRIAYYRQDLAQVPTDRTLYDIIADLRPSWGRGPIQGHLGRFGFSGDSVLRRAGSLSGGEMARVALAMMMLSGANLDLRRADDHLDVESIEALEDAIEAYDGTVLLVSHDRALLRALTTRTWVLHHGRITNYPGGFAEWELASAERAHAAAVAAAEEEAIRKVRERKQTRRPDDERRRTQTARRSAERALAEAESRVGEREARVAELREQLEDPALYLAPDAAATAARLGAEKRRGARWTRPSPSGRPPPAGGGRLTDARGGASWPCLPRPRSWACRSGSPQRGGGAVPDLGSDSGPGGWLTTVVQLGSSWAPPMPRCSTWPTSSSRWYFAGSACWARRPTPHARGRRVRRPLFRFSPDSAQPVSIRPP